MTTFGELLRLINKACKISQLINQTSDSQVTGILYIFQRKEWMEAHHLILQEVVKELEKTTEDTDKYKCNSNHPLD